MSLAAECGHSLAWCHTNKCFWPNSGADKAGNPVSGDKPTNVNFYEQGKRYRITFDATVGTPVLGDSHMNFEDLPWIFDPRNVVSAEEIPPYRVGTAYADRNDRVWLRTEDASYPWTSVEPYRNLPDNYTEDGPVGTLRELK